MLAQRLIKYLFDYNNGILTWKNPTSTKFKPGDVAGGMDGRGYLVTTIYGMRFLNHRLIFTYYYGFCPPIIDHIDGNKLNNSIENLRECTASQNNCNAGLSSKNTSGAKGVSWDKSKNKWSVKVKLNRRTYNIGRFDDFELAELVAIEAREKYHRGFARHV